MTDTVKGAGIISRLLQAMPVRPVGSDAVLTEHVKSALGRNLPEVKPAAPHGRIMSIAAGGPSLQDTYRDLEGVIVTANGGLSFLLEKGITPWGVGCFDPRQHMADIIERNEDVFYFLGSTCHPDLFEKLKGCKIGLWHPLGLPSLGELIGGRDGIGGGTTMGLRWLTLGHYMGFRKFHAHGLDSSYRGDRTHAYPDYRDGMACQEVFGFRTSQNFVQQVEDWFCTKDMFAALPEHDQPEITLHGDGLLQYCEANMKPEPEQPVDMRGQTLTAYYDLSVCPPTYDVVAFLQWAESERIERKAEGLEIVILPGPNDGFRNDTLWPHSIAERRALLDRVVVPMCELLPGASVRVAETREAPVAGSIGHGEYRIGTAVQVEAMRKGVRPLDAGVPVAFEPELVTITLRECEHWPERNSNLQGWMSFARNARRKGYRVVVVRDTLKADEPFGECITSPEASRDLHARARLYEAAVCNLFVNNGPAWLSLALDARTLIVKPTVEGAGPCFGKDYFRRCGIAPGGEIPGAPSWQKIAWATDLDINIWAAFEAFMAENGDRLQLPVSEKTDPLMAALTA